MTRDHITEKAPEIPDDIPRPDPDKGPGLKGLILSTAQRVMLVG